MNAATTFYKQNLNSEDIDNQKNEETNVFGHGSPLFVDESYHKQTFNILFFVEPKSSLTDSHYAFAERIVGEKLIKSLLCFPSSFFTNYNNHGSNQLCEKGQCDTFTLGDIAYYESLLPNYERNVGLSKFIMDSFSMCQVEGLMVKKVDDEFFRELLGHPQGTYYSPTLQSDGVEYANSVWVVDNEQMVTISQKRSLHLIKRPEMKWPTPNCIWTKNKSMTIDVSPKHEFTCRINYRIPTQLIPKNEADSINRCMFVIKLEHEPVCTNTSAEILLQAMIANIYGNVDENAEKNYPKIPQMILTYAHHSFFYRKGAKAKPIKITSH